MPLSASVAVTYGEAGVSDAPSFWPGKPELHGD